MVEPNTKPLKALVLTLIVANKFRTVIFYATTMVEKHTKQKRVVCYMPADEHDRLKKILASEGATISAWFRIVARWKVSGAEQKKQKTGQP